MLLIRLIFIFICLLTFISKKNYITLKIHCKESSPDATSLQ